MKIAAVSLCSLVTTLVALGGCASNRMFVLNPVAPGTTISSLTIRPGESSIAIDPENRADFEAALSDELTELYGVKPTPDADLIIEYRFVLYDQGNTAFRVGSNVLNLVGSPFYGLGDGAVGVEAVYFRKDGTRLAHVVTDGTISGAFGNTGSALDEAAGAIAKFTKANFACPTCTPEAPGEACSSVETP